MDETTHRHCPARPGQTACVEYDPNSGNGSCKQSESKATSKLRRPRVIAIETVGTNVAMSPTTTSNLALKNAKARSADHVAAQRHVYGVHKLLRGWHMGWRRLPSWSWGRSLGPREALPTPACPTPPHRLLPARSRRNCTPTSRWVAESRW